MSEPYREGRTPRQKPTLNMAEDMTWLLRRYDCPIDLRLVPHGIGDTLQKTTIRINNTQAFTTEERASNTCFDSELFSQGSTVFLRSERELQRDSYRKDQCRLNSRPEYHHSLRHLVPKRRPRARKYRERRIATRRVAKGIVFRGFCV